MLRANLRAIGGEQQGRVFRVLMLLSAILSLTLVVIIKAIDRAWEKRNRETQPLIAPCVKNLDKLVYAGILESWPRSS